MSVMMTIGAAYSGLKNGLGILQGLNATNTQVQVNDAKLALQQIIFDAQAALADAKEEQASSTERIRELEAEIMRLKDWSTERERYELKRFYPGTLAYALKLSMANGEPTHMLCQHCYGRNEKSILQATPSLRDKYRMHLCHSCKTEVYLGTETPAAGPIERPPSPAPRVVTRRPRSDGM